MIAHFSEPTMMPTYIVAGAPLRQIWASNAAAFGALGIFREICQFDLEITQKLEIELEC